VSNNIAETRKRYRIGRIVPRKRYRIGHIKQRRPSFDGNGEEIREIYFLIQIKDDRACRYV